MHISEEEKMDLLEEVYARVYLGSGRRGKVGRLLID